MAGTRVGTGIGRAAAVWIATAALVAVGLAVGGAATARSPAAQVDDTALGPVPLMPGAPAPYKVVITDDAVVTLAGSDGTAVYRRSVTATAAGVTLGPATFVAHSASDGGLTVHGDVVGYARPLDDRLVLAAPDGTETLLPWDDDRAFLRGVDDLGDVWVTASTLGSWERILNLSTGVEIGLPTVVPPDVQMYGSDVVHTDDRALWTAWGVAQDGKNWAATFTVALDADGPVGAPVTLDEQRCAGGSCYQRAVGFVDGMPVWARINGAGVATYRWYTAEPFTGAPHELAAPSDDASFVTGTQLAVAHMIFSTTVLRWYDLTSATPDVAVRRALVPGTVVAVGGPLVAYQDESDAYLLMDADGRWFTPDRTPASTPSFRDVPPADYGWSHPDGFPAEIMWLADHRIMRGYPDGTFRPTAAVNRDATAAFLYRAAGSPAFTPPTTPTFTDVPRTHPFYREVEWLAGAGITTGWAVAGHREYRPATPVSREAMAAFLFRFAHDGASAPACTTAPFVDVAVGQPFCGEVAWLAAAGISTGWPDHTYRPALRIERQAMAAFLVRLLGAQAPPVG